MSAADMTALIEGEGTIGTWVWDFKSDFVTGSPGMQKIMGHPQSPQISFRMYESLVHPDDRARMGDAGEFLVSHATGEHRFRILRPTGEIRWLRTRGIVIHSTLGEPLKMVGVVFDITDVRKWHEAYQQEAGLLAVIRELFDVVVSKVGADGAVVDLMEWRALTGAVGGDHLGWKRLEAVHPDDREQVKTAWASAIAGRHRYASEYRAIMADGSFVAALSRGAPIFDPRGEIANWICVSSIKATSTPIAAEAELSAAQVRAARAFLGWTKEQLAIAAGVSLSTVRRTEASPRSVGPGVLAQIRRCFEEAKVTFTAESNGKRGVLGPPPHDARRPRTSNKR
ncbi:PAS domain-containing protein [Paradevosia shaoguanensis]|uniref:PAS domain-containing protein n=1 Tax=Paradevosia shaoguanensis TaxID=1335043 RepID=UPI0019328775|nr:PAS domain-containing protein [Paradevosia shaoguanensis]